MRTKTTILAIIMLFFSTYVSIGANVRDLVVPIKEKYWKKPIPTDQFTKDIIYMMRLNNKYTLNKWYYDIKEFDKQEGEYLDFGGTAESRIRPTSHHIFILSLSLKLPIYDETVTGVSREKAKELLINLIRSVSYRHKANNPEKKGAWGDHWQSAMWAAQVAQGAWIVWDMLPEDVQEMVAKMTVYEADRFIKFKVPYYQDPEGNILHKGDTKAEENAWNSGITTIAMLMMPRHGNYFLWRAKDIELELSAYSAPKDQLSRKKIDGYRMCDILKGSNINEDGTVVNHSIIHPDYMTAIMFNITNCWASEMAGKKPLKSSLHNGDVIYRALTDNLYNGKTMYQRDENGNASCEIYFPEGNDWGGERQANYWLIDIMADVYGWNKKSDVKPIDWAKSRIVEMKRMMDRDTTGQYYQSKKEDKFYSREEWIGQHLAWGFIGWWRK